eukprot:95947-Prymnesium_polylepis.1
MGVSAARLSLPLSLNSVSRRSVRGQCAPSQGAVDHNRAAQRDVGRWGQIEVARASWVREGLDMPRAYRRFA